MGRQPTNADLQKCEKCGMPQSARLKDLERRMYLAYKQSSRENGDLDHISNSLPCIQQAEIRRAKNLGLVRVAFSRQRQDALRLAASAHERVQYTVCLRPDDPRPDDGEMYALYVDPCALHVFRSSESTSPALHGLAKAVLESYGIDGSDFIQRIRDAETLRMWNAEETQPLSRQALTAGKPRT